MGNSRLFEPTCDRLDTLVALHGLELDIRENRLAKSLGELAVQFGCELVGDPEVIVSGVSTLSSASAEDVGFLVGRAYLEQLKKTSAGVVILGASDAQHCPVNALIADDPYLVFARVAEMLHPPPSVVAGRHSSAIISASARVSNQAQISSHVVIEDDAVIEDGVFLGPGVYVGPRCKIGQNSRLMTRVVIVQDVVMGMRCIIHPGAVIGCDGFGNARSSEGWVKVPQLGGVEIGNDVEVGANSTIDRGALQNTVIEAGVRLDNLVHIAHNVHVGEHSALAAQNGVAGSTVIGKRCMFAGQVGVDGHLTICDDVIVGGKSTITKDITQPGFYVGTFSAEISMDWKRKVARFKRLDKLMRRVSNLEGRNTDDGN